MTDTQILDLYMTRCESAIEETQKQYGGYCTTIAMNILHNREDAQECVNDAYLKAWNSIPPQTPTVFSTFLGRITRNLSINKYKSRNRSKRGGGEVTLLLSELENCVPSGNNVETQVEARDLAKVIDLFLKSLRDDDNVIFVRRYWHTDSVNEIAEQFGISESKVKMSLHRTRKKLKKHLEGEGLYHG